MARVAVSTNFRLTEDNFDRFRRASKEQRERALDAVGQYAKGEARLRSPVDTGHLRENIEYKSDDKQAIIGTDVEYGVYVEKGTRKMDAQPYITPAVEENQHNINTLFERYLDDYGDG